MFVRNWRYIAAIGLVVLALGGLGYTNLPECPYLPEGNITSHDYTQYQTQAEQRYSAEAPEEDGGLAALSVSPQGQGGAAAREEVAEQHASNLQAIDTCAQEWMATWTIYIGVLTGLGVFLLAGTLWEAQRTTKAATAASVAATAHNEHAATTAQRELRAYISVEPAGINQLIGTTTAMGHVDVRNVGKIPARNVSVDVRMKVATNREDLFPLSLSHDTKVDRVIQPGTHMTQGSKDRVPLSEITRNETGYVFVWGLVVYDDGFPNQRTTQFCHRYANASYNRDVSGQVTKKTEIIIDREKARYHPMGNNAD